MKIIIILLLGLLLILFYSCGLPADGSGSQSLDYNLRGVWETDKESKPGIPSKPGDSLYARIEIDYKDITIIGNIAHFENFTKNTPLEAYTTKDSLIYIYDRGEWQMNPIPYRAWKAGSSYPGKKMLTLRANGLLKDETFKFIEDVE